MSLLTLYWSYHDGSFMDITVGPDKVPKQSEQKPQQKTEPTLLKHKVCKVIKVIILHSKQLQ